MLDSWCFCPFCPSVPYGHTRDFCDTVGLAGGTARAAKSKSPDRPHIAEQTPRGRKHTHPPKPSLPINGHCQHHHCSREHPGNRSSQAHLRGARGQEQQGAARGLQPAVRLSEDSGMVLYSAGLPKPSQSPVLARSYSSRLKIKLQCLFPS